MVNNKLKDKCLNIGWIVARYPWYVMSVCLLISLNLLFGTLNMKIDIDIIRGFTGSHSAEVWDNFNKMEKYYSVNGGEFTSASRAIQFIYFPTSKETIYDNDEGRNKLRELLVNIAKLESEVNSMSTKIRIKTEDNSGKDTSPNLNKKRIL